MAIITQCIRQLWDTAEAPNRTYTVTFTDSTPSIIDWEQYTVSLENSGGKGKIDFKKLKMGS